jgi:uncharacterized protein YdeI (YjbR/CyaY-like superfamily)
VQTLHVTTRATWRSWLRRNHSKKDGIWLVYARKHTGEPRISYNEAVEEALCFGWIDSIQRGVDDDHFAQRFSPRRPGSPWSEMNRQRLRKLVAEGLMTPAGMAVVGDALDERPLELARDVERALREDPDAWRNYRAFPDDYRRLRIAYIEAARKRPDEFAKRLRNFVAKTSKGQRIGYVKEFRGDRA